MTDETTRRYLFVAIDRATRWVHLRIYADQGEASSADFLRRLHAFAPMRIEKLLIGNGSPFTDRFTGNRKAPSGQHAFDRECMRLGIEHWLTQLHRPQTSGMVERFNGRISDILATVQFRASESLQTAIARYTKLYNDHLPRKALVHKTPLQGDAYVARASARTVR